MRASKRKGFVFGAALALALLGCAGTGGVADAATAQKVTKKTESAAVAKVTTKTDAASPAGTSKAGAKDEKGQETLRLSVGDTQVDVTWEQNASVEALRDAASKGTVAVDAHRYGGFEQVGPLGMELPSEDTQVSTVPGDIVLYQGDQISIFYGENSWAYTRLGHITNLGTQELEALLGSEDQTITISMN